MRLDEKTLRALPPGLTLPEMAQRLGVDLSNTEQVLVCDQRQLKFPSGDN